MPGPPPMNRTAAMTLVMKKPIATGMPSIISPSAQAGDHEQRVFTEGEEVRRALVAEVAQHHVEGDGHHHGGHQEPGEVRHPVEDGVVAFDYVLHSGVKSLTTRS